MNHNIIEFREKYDFASYGGIAYLYVENIEQHKRVNEHSWASNEASDAPAPRSAAASGRLFLPDPARWLSLLGDILWLAQPRSSTREAATGI